MKKIITIFTGLVLLGGISYAQNINMGIDTPEGSINMGVDIKETDDGVIMNMQMNTPDGAVNMGTSANSKGIQQNMDVRSQSQERQATDVEVAMPISDEVVHQQAQQNTKRCAYAMAANNFTTLLNSVKSKSFADDQTAIVQQAIANNCLNSNQVKDLLRLFSFEEDKLNIAKLCYACVVDKQNYFVVNDMFTFSDSVDQLTSFIQSGK